MNILTINFSVLICLVRSIAAIDGCFIMNNIVIKLIWFISLQLNLYGIMRQETMETVIGAGKYDVLACSLNCSHPICGHTYPLGSFLYQAVKC